MPDLLLYRWEMLAITHFFLTCTIEEIDEQAEFIRLGIHDPYADILRKIPNIQDWLAEYKAKRVRMDARLWNNKVRKAIREQKRQAEAAEKAKTREEWTQTKDLAKLEKARETKLERLKRDYTRNRKRMKRQGASKKELARLYGRYYAERKKLTASIHTQGAEFEGNGN